MAAEGGGGDWEEGPPETAGLQELASGFREERLLLLIMLLLLLPPLGSLLPTISPHFFPTLLLLLLSLEEYPELLSPVPTPPC